MWALMAFTPAPASTSDVTQQKKDSTQMVNVKFSPAQIVVNDNRTVEGISAIIEKNSESNSEIAKAINRAVDAALVSAEERRCVSLMDRITQQTNLSVNEINKILHKKRIFDMIFYTIFLAFLIYTYLEVGRKGYIEAVSLKHFGVTVTGTIFQFLALLFIYKYLGGLINGPHYPIIQSIINSPPG
jgi:hypothetical protein